MTLFIEFDREDDGRWLADIPALPGVTAYGASREEATYRVKALALHVIADRIENGEADEDAVSFLIKTAA